MGEVHYPQIGQEGSGSAPWPSHMTALFSPWGKAIILEENLALTTVLSRCTTWRPATCCTACRDARQLLVRHFLLDSAVLVVGDDEPLIVVYNLATGESSILQTEISDFWGR